MELVEDYQLQVEHVTDPATKLTVRSAAVVYGAFPTVEWTLSFANGGASDTPLISDIRSIDIRLERAAQANFRFWLGRDDPCRWLELQTGESWQRAPWLEFCQPLGHDRLRACQQRLETEIREAGAGGEGRRTIDELVVVPGGLAIEAWTVERNGQTFRGDGRPKRVYRKISDRVEDPPR